jgi:predicted Fe-Mo cluster-binding NifX family protein
MRPEEKIMKVGFAVQGNEGVESKIFNHFGSAPAFIIIDTEDKEVVTVINKDLHHVHGACNPIMALDGKSVNAMVVGGIGAGALMKLQKEGIRVFRAVEGNVSENLELLKSRKLPELAANMTCGGHDGGHGCVH